MVAELDGRVLRKCRPLWFWRKGRGYRYVCALADVDYKLISRRVVELYPPESSEELEAKVA